jgi:hypothetical protein
VLRANQESPAEELGRQPDRKRARFLGAAPKIDWRDYALEKSKAIRLGDTAALLSYEVAQHWTMEGQEGPPHIRASSARVESGSKWLFVLLSKDQR